MPFNYTTTSRKVFAAKAFTFMGLGFTIPFVAIWWHWSVPPATFITLYKGLYFL